MLIGGDISHWNLTVPLGLGFIFIKATEGRNFVDTSMSKHLENIASKYNQLPIIGFYHFARPSKNNPEQEAEHFIKTVKPHLGSCLLALDWEDALYNSIFTPQRQADWIRQFMVIINQETPARCILYGSRSTIKSLINVGNLDKSVPLWIADYNKDDTLLKKDIKRPITFRQFADYPFDLDYTELPLKEIIGLANK